MIFFKSPIQYICDLPLNFNSTSTMKEYSLLNAHFPSCFIWSKVLPLHINLLYYSITEHDFPSIQNTQWIWLELSLGFPLYHREFNNVIRIMYILFKD